MNIIHHKENIFKMSGEEQHPDRYAPTPLTSGELKAPAGNPPSPVKGWTQSGRGSRKKNTTP